MNEDQEQQLDKIIADFLQSQEEGNTIVESDIIDAHPEFADELRSFFNDLGQMEAMAGPLVTPSATQTPELEKIRYFGDYELLEEIARGGMGVVYKANQTSLNRIVAVKLILSGQLAGDSEVKRFRSEAEAAASLKHPNIVAVHEVGQYQDQNYFSMDFIEGRNLSAMVREHPLPAKDAARYVHQIAVAIHYAHQQGTLHRDLKPSNVLIDGNDNVQITDFGLATRVEGDSDLTRTGQILGTPSYMPPEQAQSARGDIGAASDVYSIGAILYELLTGRPPFRAESALETLKQVIEAEPPSPQLLNAQVPKDLSTISMKCLQKEPKKRYATAGELAADLQRYLNGEPILARPVGQLERTWRWCKRNPSSAGLVVAVLVLVFGLFSGALWYVDNLGRQEAERIRILTEQESRVKGLEQGMEEAIANAISLRTKSLDMTSQPFEWGVMLASARSSERRAQSLMEQEAALIDPRLKERLEAIQDQLSQDEQDQQFVSHYEQIRLDMDRVNVDASTYDRSHAFPDMMGLLQQYGFHPDQISVKRAVDLLEKRPETIKQQWIVALEFCLTVTSIDDNDDVNQWILSLLRKVDSNLWRNEVRQAFVRKNRGERLKQLAGEVKNDLGAHPPSLLIMLAEQLAFSYIGDDGIGLLVRVHALKPDDFWVNQSAGYQLMYLAQHLEKDMRRKQEAQHHFCSALSYYRAALALRPQSAGVWVNYGLQILHTGDVTIAETAFRNATRLQPDYSVAWDNLGLALVQQHNDEDAEVCFREAMKLAPQDPQPYENLGDVFTEREEFLEAEEWYRQALALDETRVRSWYGLANMQRKAGNLEEAKRSYLKALELDSENVRVHYNLGLLYRDLGDIPKVQEHLQKAGELGSADAWYNLGNLKQSVLVQHREAIDLYDRAIELDPTSVLPYLNRGIALNYLKEYTEAEKSILAGIERDPEFGQAYNNLGVVYFNQGDYPKAIAQYQKAIKRGYFDAYYNLGNVYERQEKPYEALEAYRIGMVEGSLPACLRLATILHEQGELEEVKTCYLRAIELVPDNLAHHAAFIYSCFVVGEIPNAISSLRSRLRSVQPTRTQSRCLLGLLRYSGDLEGYKQLCRQLFDGYPENGIDRHQLLLAHLLHPDVEVTPEVLDLAEREVADGSPLAKLISGIAQYRRQQYKAASEIMRQIPVADLPYDNRFQSQLYLGLALLRSGGREKSRMIFESMRESYMSSTSQLTDSARWSRQPWGELPPLWREVANVLEEEGLDEAVPELPPTYSETLIPQPGLRAAGDLEFTESLVRSEMGRVVSVEVSSDGRFAYSAAFDTGSVDVFERNPGTGQLTHIQTVTHSDYLLKGAVCVRLSKDDHNRLAATAAFGVGTVILYLRDPENGKLTIVDVAREREHGVSGIQSAIEVSFSPDSNYLYVVSSKSNALTWFRIEENKLVYIGKLLGPDNQFGNARGLCMSPNGDMLYVAGQAAGMLTALSIDPKDGRPSIADIQRNGDGIVGLEGVFSVTCSPDGRFVYTNSGCFGGDDAVCVFEQLADGTLKFLEVYRNGVHGIQGLHGGNELVLSPDGQNLYALGSKANAIVCFDRNPETGKLDYRHRILSELAGVGPLRGISGIATSPDGKYIYGAVQDNSSISIFKRH